MSDCKWTCGRCGDIFEASGSVADLQVHRWRREHIEEHRVEDMTEAERQRYWADKAEAWARRVTLA